MADEGADEVKVFRRTDAEDLETNAQSSHQLAEDKKDVVLETELESRPNGDPLIGRRTNEKMSKSPSNGANAFMVIRPSMAMFGSCSLRPLLSEDWQEWF
ncbi:unnamed protein product [Haemonchus placei]|uniref:CTNNB1_binding domain-containing protein n=1 Tax=Haemonchus placei TaxID=6290 RepID=A0A0N4W1H3_HAEPC|nr:unnamed protein product [Haemonchus placei]